MAGPMADLIGKHGGVPLEAPALREIPIDDNPEALAFADRLIAGELRRRHLRDRRRRALPDPGDRDAHPSRNLVRRPGPHQGRRPRAQAGGGAPRAEGPGRPPGSRAQHLARDAGHPRRPAAGRRPPGRRPGVRQAEPRADRGARSGAGPSSRGCRSTAGPCPRIPARSARRSPRSPRAGSGAVLFTAAQQVVHLLQVAPRRSARRDLRVALGRDTVVGSIGPTTSETLREHGLPVDIEPEHPKMGHLVAAVAAGWRGIGKAK